MKLRSLKFKSVKSTNDVALMLIKKNNTRPSIILSERQTKGRGTMGKKWVSKKGNLFLSIFFDMSKKKIDFKKFAVLNAYLLKSVLAKKFSNKIKIKWPNDLLYKKKKLQTITLELQSQCAVRAMNTVGWVVCQRPLAVLVNNCLAPTIKM